MNKAPKAASGWMINLVLSRFSCKSQRRLLLLQLLEILTVVAAESILRVYRPHTQNHKQVHFEGGD